MRVFEERSAVQRRHGPVAAQGHLPPYLGYPRLVLGPQPVVGKAEGKQRYHGDEEKQEIKSRTPVNTVR